MEAAKLEPNVPHGALLSISLSKRFANEFTRKMSKLLII